jgi:hypothetical protein
MRRFGLPRFAKQLTEQSYSRERCG